jgi:hypothetical protein
MDADVDVGTVTQATDVLQSAARGLGDFGVGVLLVAAVGTHGVETGVEPVGQGLAILAFMFGVSLMTTERVDRVYRRAV